jgi:Methylamine utilisation protein MauE
MKTENRLPLALLLMRLTVFLVMFMWTIDKFIQPQHSAKIMEHFYFMPGVASTVIYVVGALELALILGFVTGIAKKWSYGLVLLLHGVSTVSSYKQYLHPFEAPNLLFFAAWPMLAACFALYVLRDSDVFWTVESRGATR